MAKNPKKENNNNVVAITRCCADTCNKRDNRAGFCDEHFTWFKEGLITSEGHKVKDFDKKLQQFKARVA